MAVTGQVGASPSKAASKRPAAAPWQAFKIKSRAHRKGGPTKGADVCLVQRLVAVLHGSKVQAGPFKSAGGAQRRRRSPGGPECMLRYTAVATTCKQDSALLPEGGNQSNAAAS